ncbi:MAG: hypothetical protein HUU60_11535 [Armatimonadetes bacterium]|nr:hypothetical protein [Armatimonadota bacterium]
MSVKTSAKGVGVLLGGVAGAAAMGPLGAYFGASLGTAAAGVLSAEAVAAISDGIAAIGVEMIGRALGDFKNNRQEKERLKLNHDVARAVTQALANAMHNEAKDDLTRFWAKGLEYAAKNTEAHQNLYKTAHEPNWEQETLKNLSDSEKLDDLVWKDVCNFLLRLPEWPGDCCRPWYALGFNRRALKVNQVSEPDRTQRLVGLRDKVLPKMVKAYADAIAKDPIARDKSFHYMLQVIAQAQKVDSAKLDQILGQLKDLKPADHSSLLLGQASDEVRKIFSDLEAAIRDEGKKTREHVTKTTKEIKKDTEAIKAGVAAVHADVKKLQGAHALIPSNLPKDPVTAEIERPELMKEIGTKLQNGPAVRMGGRATLQGHGGQGKTTLAYAYGRANFDNYPGGVYVVNCAGAQIVEPFVALRLQNEKVGEPPPEHPEQIVSALLSDPNKKALVIFDNVDSKEQWDEFVPLLPNCDIIVTTQDENIDPQGAIKVEHFSFEQARKLLGNYRESALKAENEQNIKSIHRDTEGLAALIAAIGMAMSLDKSDGWSNYANWLANVDIGQYPKLKHYPHTTAAILDGLRSKLTQPQQRVLEYASLLPPEALREWWLKWLLQHDGVDLGTDSRGEPREPSWHLEGLKDLGLLRPMDEAGETWSINRLHLKRAQEALSATMTVTDPMASKLVELARTAFERARVSQEELRYSHAIDFYTQCILIMESQREALGKLWPAEFQNNLAGAYANRGSAKQDLQQFGAAIADYGEAIEIREALREAFEESGQPWPAEFQNDLAKAYLNRGNVKQDLQQFDAAIADYGEAIKLMKALREAFEKSGEQWPAQFQNDLAGAYMNRGNAKKGLQQFGAAIADYGEAIEIREALRKAFEESGQPWPAEFQNDLAKAYMNRGNAKQGLQQFGAAVADYGKAIEIMETLREAFEESGQPWPAEFQNDLAAAYLNRGVARNGLQQFGAAVADCGEAIELMKALRKAFEESRQPWPAAFQNDLARAYMNRGNAKQGLQQFDAAIEDCGEAIKLMKALRKAFEESRQPWPAAFQNDLARAYLNRGNAQQGLQQFGAAIADYDKAIQIRVALRKALGDQWPAQFQNDLAKAYMNRGNAQQGLQQFGAAVEDYDKAIEIARNLRALLEPRGHWAPELRYLYALILGNRAIAYDEVGQHYLAIADREEAESVWPA